MADAKPAAPAPAPAPAPKKAGDPFVEIIIWIFGVFVAVYLLNGLLSVVDNALGAFQLKNITPSSIWKAHTRPIASLLHPLGSTVVSLGEKISLFGTAGGAVSGTEKMGSHGKIIQGPVTFAGERYWLVRFDDGTVGWVKESDIGYLQSEPSPVERFIMRVNSWLPIVGFILAAISILCIILFIWISRKMAAIQKNTKELLYPKLAAEEAQVNPRWERVVTLSESPNEADWRVAILEADIMLDDLLDKLNLPGETMGDKLKAVEPSDFATLQDAWEAHKVRNRVAHDGPDFILTSRETKRIIILYKNVFEEFGMI